jgi:3-oxoacyl-[acyl-carrier protein] reductase
MQDLKGKAVLVTGASTGIGAAVARAFAANGARTMLHYNRNRESAAALADAIRADGGEASIVAGNVADLAAVSAIVRETMDTFGALDILVNNAGDMVRRTPVAEYDEQLIDDVLAVNVRQLVWFVREATPLMRAQGGGCIINTTSIAARHGGGPGAVLYAAAKGFVSTATRGWARELAPDRIRVNGVSPGVILTPFHDRFSSPEALAGMKAQIPMGRLGAPEDCIGTYLYLASGETSGYVTGQVIEVNGGQLML